MGKLIYVPDVIKKSELIDLLNDIKNLSLQVDHAVTRTLLNDVYSEMLNEISIIEEKNNNQS